MIEGLIEFAGVKEEVGERGREVVQRVVEVFAVNIQI